jgi:hypothetical protein
MFGVYSGMRINLQCTHITAPKKKIGFWGKKLKKKFTMQRIQKARNTVKIFREKVRKTIRCKNYYKS